MKLYTYFRSSAAYRVRIALNLKGLSYDPVFVHLTRDGDGQFEAHYRRLNPQALVPTLVDDKAALTQSLAIIEYLEEMHPEPPLLPGDAVMRARIRAVALAIACDIHPINNLRVLKYLTGELGAAEGAKDAWYRHWVETGLASVEKMVVDAGLAGNFCFGDTATLADVVLVPQVFNARRFDADLSACPTIVRIADHANGLKAFADAAPGAQPDAE